MKRLVTKKLFDAKIAIHLIKKHKITVLLLPPSQARAVLQNATKEDLSSIRLFLTGAAVVSDFLLENARKLMPTAEIANGYGMSEGGKMFRKEMGHYGTVTDNVQLKIVDENGNALGPNQRGVIMVYPLFKFLGYCNAPEKTEAIYKDGWICTGDYGYISNEGELTIMDRATELLKCGDEIVCLSEIEAELEKIETVADFCAIGIPDKERNHILAALVVKDPGSKLTEADIFKITSEKLTPNKHLLGGIFFADNIPKTTSGKLLRRAVREIIASKISERK